MKNYRSWKIFLFLLTIVLLKINFSTQSFLNFPEDISSLDYLIYSDKEFHLASFYYTTTGTDLKYDYRNGIPIYPFSDVILFIYLYYSVLALLI